MEKLQTRTAEIRRDSVDQEKRTAQFVISTEAVDSYNTVFRLDGWDLDNYNRNPIVGYNHDIFGEPDNIIGTSRVFRDGNQLIGEVTFEDADINPKAEKVFRKVVNGTLRMASINASVKSYERGKRDKGEDPDVVYFTRQNLNEWSIVSIGSNPEAYKRNNEELEALRKEAENKKATETVTVTNEDIQGAIEGSKRNVKDKKKRALTRFEAQLIVNQNRKVK